MTVTPAAKALLVGSIVMAVVSAIANLSAVDDLTTDASLELAMHASTVASMIFALIAGVYSATTDHRFGLIDQRLLSEPNRRRVVGTKLAASSLLGAVYGLVGVATAVATISSYFGLRDVPLDLGSPIVVRSLIGVLLATPLFGAMGAAVGTAIRHQPPALAGSLVWLFIVEPALMVGWTDVGRWLPGAAGVALTASPDPALLGQLGGGAVLVGYVVLSVIVSVWRFDRFDL